MSIVKDYMMGGGGNWANAQNTAAGVEVVINEVYLDKETFDNAYICINGVGAGGEPAKVRLGRQNVARIAEVLGDDETKWVGQKLRCIGKQMYPGLGKEGLLWTGEKSVPTPQQTGIKPSPNTSLQISKEAYDWVVANQALIGRQIPWPDWGKISLGPIPAELNRVGAVEMLESGPLLTEKARTFL